MESPKPLLTRLRNGPPRYDYDGFWSFQLMVEAADEIEKLRNQYNNLLGQVVQARDGFGIYHDSPTMADAIKVGEEYFAALKIESELNKE